MNINAIIIEKTPTATRKFKTVHSIENALAEAWLVR